MNVSIEMQKVAAVMDIPVEAGDTDATIAEVVVNIQRVELLRPRWEALERAWDNYDFAAVVVEAEKLAAAAA